MFDGHLVHECVLEKKDELRLESSRLGVIAIQNLWQGGVLCLFVVITGAAHVYRKAVVLHWDRSGIHNFQVHKLVFPDG